MALRKFLPALLALFLVVLLIVPVLAAPSYSSWGAAVSLESVNNNSSHINTEFQDGCPIFSRDGQQLFIASNRPGGLGGIDIWIATRTSPGGPFGDPVNPGAPINSAADDFCPSPLRDGQGFLFVSTRPGGCGGGDIYYTRRDPLLTWDDPENLGCEVNSPAGEAGPVVSYAEASAPVLYFSSNRTGGMGGSDLYESKMGTSGDWGTPQPVPRINSTFEDARPSISRDGRTLYFDSNRPGGKGAFDIYAASRETIASPWETPVNLGENVNSAAPETRASISWDGSTLLFGTGRSGIEGVSDIFFSTRE